jgi:uncharacterized protein DUF6968
MKRDLEFNEPIAERIIEGNDCTIIVQLGPPRPETNDDEPDWYCAYRITGIPGEPDHKMYGGGVDAIDAIIAALCNLGAELNYCWKDRLGLNWLDVEHLGFLDAHKLPGGECTPEEERAREAITDVWLNPTSTPEEREAIIDKFFQEHFFQQQRESETD